MSKSVLLDANFIVGLFNEHDALHEDSKFIFKLLWKERRKIKLIIPPLCIYEVIIVLKRAGVTEGTIQEKVMRLITLDNVIVHSINEMSAFRHCDGPLGASTLKTNDFIIASTGMDYEALIITFDKGMRDRVKPTYTDIFYCKRSEEMATFINRFYAEVT